MNHNQARNIVLYSFIGDALSLGPHWIYRQSEIARRVGDVRGYVDPLSNYHPGKKAGDFTHYGDQTLALLRSVATAKRFEIQAFARVWRSFWEDPATISYQDGATRATLQNLERGTLPQNSASGSNDIAGAARIAPLFLLQWESTDALLSAAREQTSFTHGDEAVIESAEFFARLALRVGDGEPVPEALKSVAEMNHWQAIPQEWFEAAVRSSSSGKSTENSAAEHGLSCHIPDAFPVVCDLLLRYPDDPVTALTKNAQAGGDAAARGMILGLIYGARPEAAALPEEWFSGLTARDEIEQLMTRLSSETVLKDEG